MKKNIAIFLITLVSLFCSGSRNAYASQPVRQIPPICLLTAEYDSPSYKNGISQVDVQKGCNLWRTQTAVRIVSVIPMSDRLKIYGVMFNLNSTEYQTIINYDILLAAVITTAGLIFIYIKKRKIKR